MKLSALWPPASFGPLPKSIRPSFALPSIPSAVRSIPDLTYFHQFTKTIFIHRRKFLRANVVAALKGRLSKEEIDAELAAMGFKPNARTEELSVSTLLEFTERIRRLAPDWKL